MSKFKVLDNINDNIEDIKAGQIYFFIDEKSEISDASKEIIASQFSDPNIGFVYTDAMIQTEECSFIEYLSGKDLPDIPFAIKIPEGISLSKVEDGSRALLMRQLASQGLYFIHIADPHTIIKE